MTTRNPQTASLVAHVLELAEVLDWPAVEIPPHGTVGPGRDAWLTWVAQADREQLAAAIGVTVVWVHRDPAPPAAAR
jgi:hypothetical protein